MRGSQTERHIASFCYHMHEYGAIHQKSHVARKKNISADASFETTNFYEVNIYRTCVWPFELQTRNCEEGLHVMHCELPFQIQHWCGVF